MSLFIKIRLRTTRRLSSARDLSAKAATTSSISSSLWSDSTTSLSDDEVFDVMREAGMSVPGGFGNSNSKNPDSNSYHHSSQHELFMSDMLSSPCRYCRGVEV